MAKFDIANLLSNISAGASDTVIKELAAAGDVPLSSYASTPSAIALAPPGSSPLALSLAELSAAVERRAPGLVDFMDKVLRHAHEDPSQVMALTDEQLAVFVNSAQALASSPKSVVRASIKEEARLLSQGFGDDENVEF